MKGRGMGPPNPGGTGHPSPNGTSPAMRGVPALGGWSPPALFLFLPWVRRTTRGTQFTLKERGGGRLLAIHTPRATPCSPLALLSRTPHPLTGTVRSSRREPNTNRSLPPRSGSGQRHDDPGQPLAPPSPGLGVACSSRFCFLPSGGWGSPTTTASSSCPACAATL